MSKSFDIHGQQITPVHAPQARLDAILDTISGAQSSLCMFSYMFGDDESAAEVSTALQDAAARGVHVQLMIDDFGSGNTDSRFFDSLIASGVNFRRFGARRNLGYFVRNHQKILIADRCRAVIGGFNITDSYFGRSGEHDWEDFGLIVSGEIVTFLYDYFQKLFDLDQGKGVSFLKLRQLLRGWHHRDGPISWQIGGPSNRMSPWARSLKHDLENAEQLDLVSAYFFPTQSIVRRIAAVVRKSAGGRIILAGKTDNGATIGAARSLYFYLLKRGARIFEFQPRRLHMKLLVMDDVSYVGSSNLDVRSLFINMEIMLRIEDAEFADYLRQIMSQMAEDSEEQTIAVHRRRASIFRRIKWALSYLLVNGVDFTIGRRIKFGLMQKP